MSSDAVHWTTAENPLCFDFDIEYDDGAKCTLQRRERPFLFSDNGRQYLFTTAKLGGEEILTGGKTWNMVQKLKNGGDGK